MDTIEQARQDFMCGKISAEDYNAIREIEYADIVDMDYIRGLHKMEEKSVKAAEDYYAGKISKEEYDRIQQEYYNY